MLRILAVGAALLVVACDKAPSNDSPSVPDVATANGTTANSPPSESTPDVAASQRGSAKAIAYGVQAYPGARPLGDSPDYLLKEGKNPRWLQYESNDKPAAVIAFYKQQAAAAGFAVIEEKERKLARSISLKTARPGGGVMNVNTLEQVDDKTMINLHISEDG